MLMQWRSRYDYKLNAPITSTLYLQFYFSGEQRLISCLGWCTGVAAREPQLGEGVEQRDIDGVGVGSSLKCLPPTNFNSLSSSISLFSSVSSSSSRNVRSSEEAQGARKPTREGNPDSKLSVASVLSPSKVKSEQGIKINGNTQHSAQRGQSGRTPFFICHDTIIYHYLFNLW